MKTLLRHSILLLLLFLLSRHAEAQSSLQSSGKTIINDLHPGSGMQIATVTCSTDTIYYPYYKATSLQAVNVVNNASNGNAFSQWYPAPQSMSISGFDFFAWAPNYNGTITLTCNLYLAGADSMPTGSPVRSTTVTVDSTFTPGTLAKLRKSAVFPTAYTTSSAYVLTIESSSSANVAIVSNDWTTSNGASQWLSSVRFGSNWQRSYVVNVNSVTFNADFLLLPYVTYSLSPNFTVSNTCISNNTTVNFTNTTSAAVNSRFYNRWAINNLTQYSYLWDFGNGSNYTINPTRTYNFAGNYTVTLNVTQLGFTMSCVDTKMVNLFATPATPFPVSNSPVCLGDSITLSAGSSGLGIYRWVGPNNFLCPKSDTTILVADTSHTGTYGVSVTTNGCVSQIGTLLVQVKNRPAAPTVSNNGPLCNGQDLELNASSISGASYEWTGPNSFSSTSQTPFISAITASDTGLYEVKVMQNGCYSLSASTRVALTTTPVAPVIGNNGPICPGQTLNLNASLSSNATYAWTGPNSYSSSSRNPSISNVNANHAGTYTCKITVAGCGTSPQASTSVIINPLPPSPLPSSNGPVCAGQTLNLNASFVTGAAYNWTGPNGFSSSSQNPDRSSFSVADTGLYFVSATVIGCGTSASNGVRVELNPGPAIPLPSTNGPLCEGSTLNLSVPGVSGITYNWTGPNGFSSSLQNPVLSNVTLALKGSYAVTATQPNCGTSAAGTILVQIDPIPIKPSVSANSPLCEGTKLQLQTDSVAGADYFWSGPSSFSSPLRNPAISTVAPTQSGLYAIYNKVGACNSPTAFIYVAVINKPTAPTLSSNSPVCEGDPLSLSCNVVGADYFWSGPAAFIAFDQNPVRPGVIPAHTGKYYGKVKVGGCLSDSILVNVLVSSRPVLSSSSLSGPQNANRNKTANYSVPLNAGSTYDWQISGGTQTAGGNTNAITVQWGDFGAGSITVTETNAQSCISLPLNKNIGLWYTSTDPLSKTEQNINIYPVPSRGILYLDWESARSEKNSISVLNSLGQVLLKKDVELLAGLNKLSLDLSALPAGVYMLQAEGWNNARMILKQ